MQIELAAHQLPPAGNASRPGQLYQAQLRIGSTLRQLQPAAAIGIHAGETEVVVAGGDIQPGRARLCRQLHQIPTKLISTAMHTKVGQVLTKAQQPQPRHQLRPLRLTPQLRRQHRHHERTGAVAHQQQLRGRRFLLQLQQAPSQLAHPLAQLLITGLAEHMGEADRAEQPHHPQSIRQPPGLPEQQQRRRQSHRMQRQRTQREHSPHQLHPSSRGNGSQQSHDQKQKGIQAAKRHAGRPAGNAAAAPAEAIPDVDAQGIADQSQRLPRPVAARDVVPVKKGQLQAWLPALPDRPAAEQAIRAAAPAAQPEVPAAAVGMAIELLSEQAVVVSPTPRIKAAQEIHPPLGVETGLRVHPVDPCRPLEQCWG